MQLEYLNINLFYPLLFFTIVIVLGLIAFCYFKTKDTFIFAKSSDNAKDVSINNSDNMTKINTNIVDGLPVQYHKELHSLETSMKNLTLMTEDINKKVDILIAQFAKNKKVIDITSKKHK